LWFCAEYVAHDLTHGVYEDEIAWSMQWLPWFYEYSQNDNLEPA
jgi:hypothetical protein